MRVGERGKLEAPRGGLAHTSGSALCHVSSLGLPHWPLGRGPLTVPGLAVPPSVRCRWQLKISSARRRYLVIFSFTASHRSLLGSTVGGQAFPGP